MTPTWLLLEVTAILTLALAGVRLARRSRAAVRHVLLAGAFAVLLVLPFASIVMPAIRVEVPASVHAAISPLDLEFDAATIDDAIRPAVANAASNTQAPAEAEGPSWSWPSLSTLLLATWITGTALFLVPVLVGLWQVRMLRRSGLPWRSGGAAVGALANDAGIHRGIDVLLHESVPGPMTCGVLHPAIVLPNDAERWAPEDLTRAIVHELEHVRRVDWISHCLARIVAACYWFHPIVWIAWRQLVLEAERACDDAVLRRSEATAYADQLVELAQRLSAASSQPQLAMANRRDLHTRVLAVLDSRQRRGRAGVAAIVVAIAACALLVMTMSPLRIVAASVETVQDPSHKFDVVSIKPCPGLPPPGSGRMVAPQAAQTSPGYVHWSCISLAELIDQAYARPDTPLLNMNMMSLMPGDLGKPGAPRRIRGGPSWIESDRWAIEAKASGEAGKPAPYGAARYLPPAMNDALKAMLADRFQLKLRRATEQQPMYALTVAKGGLKIRAATPDDCFEMIVDAATGLRTKPPGSEDKMVCGTGRKFGRGNSINEYRGTTLKGVAEGLSSVMDRFVLDQTGVDGKFTFTLKYTPDEHTPAGGPNLLHAAEVGRAAGAAMSPLPTTPPEGDAPNIFKALEALGLKLEPTKGPAEYFQIDSVQKPKPDQPTFAAEAASAFARASADKSAGTSGNTPDGSSTIQSAGTNTQSAAVTPGQVKFDVVSIKPCAGLPPAGTGRGLAPWSAQYSPNYVRWDCVTLAELIDQTYAEADNPLLNMLTADRENRPKRLRGGPAWVDSDRFTIEAKVSGDSNKPEMTRAAYYTYMRPAVNSALRAMLADRFQLKLKRATEQQSMYALTVAPGGLNKTKMIPTGSGDCWAWTRGTPRNPPPGFEDKPMCGNISARSGGPGEAPIPGIVRMTFTGRTMASFATQLASTMDRFVIDRTGVDGMFNFMLVYAEDDSTPAYYSPNDPYADRARAEREARKNNPPAGPSIFKALEALGLKLEPTKGPAEYFQIESVQRPRPDGPSDTLGPLARATGAGSPRR